MTRIWGRNPDDYKAKVRDKRQRNLHARHLHLNGPKPKRVPKKTDDFGHDINPRNYERYT